MPQYIINEYEVAYLRKVYKIIYRDDGFVFYDYYCNDIYKENNIISFFASLLDLWDDNYELYKKFKENLEISIRYHYRPILYEVIKKLNNALIKASKEGDGFYNIIRISKYFFEVESYYPQLYTIEEFVKDKRLNELAINKIKQNYIKLMNNKIKLPKEIYNHPASDEYNLKKYLINEYIEDATASFVSIGDGVSLLNEISELRRKYQNRVEYLRTEYLENLYEFLYNL